MSDIVCNIWWKSPMNIKRGRHLDEGKVRTGY